MINVPDSGAGDDAMADDRDTFRREERVVLEVATLDPRDVEGALAWCVEQMEREALTPPVLSALYDHMTAPDFYGRLTALNKSRHHAGLPSALYESCDDPDLYDDEPAAGSASQ